MPCLPLRDLQSPTMAVLTIHFTCDDSTFTMHSIDPDSSSDSWLTIRKATAIHRGDRNMVYKGELIMDNTKDVIEVAVKFIAGESPRDLADLEYEYGRYTCELKELQGQIVPTCYGLFQIPEQHTAYLVLQYCGEPISGEFDDLDMDGRSDESCLPS